MKKIVIVMALCIMLCGVSYAQQDPNDPGLQDSLIIETVVIDTPGANSNVSVWAVTDDSIAYYNIPIRWTAPQGGVHLELPNFYYNQVALWDIHYDSMMIGQNYIRMIGFANIADSTNPPMFTYGQRWHIFTFRCVIDQFRSQNVIFDTCYDDRAHSISFGLSNGMTEFTPAVVRGILRIMPLDAEDGDELPVEYSLSSNYPNPFNPETNIDFALPKESYVSLVVYNLLGQEVKTIVNGTAAAGEHTALWNGKDDNGREAPSGVYFYKLYTPEFTQTYKMTLLR